MERPRAQRGSSQSFNGNGVEPVPYPRGSGGQGALGWKGGAKSAWGPRFDNRSTPSRFEARCKDERDHHGAVSQERVFRCRDPLERYGGIKLHIIPAIIYNTVYAVCRLLYLQRPNAFNHLHFHPG